MSRFAAIVVFALTCTAGLAQPADSTATFEAATVKPWVEGTLLVFSGCDGGPGYGDPAQITCKHATLKVLLTRAYQVKAQEIFGPAWLETAYFDVLAKVPHGATKDQVPAMFRNLLAEHFKVELHHENRMLPGYAITVAKSGLKIKESPPPSAEPPDDPPPGTKLKIDEDGFPILRPSTIASGPMILYRNGHARLQAGNTTMAMLADALSRQLERVVLDETGLTAKYDMTLNWTPDSVEPGGNLPRAGTQEAAAPAADLVGAMEKQLGLKLVSKKVSRDTVVVDRAEKVQ